jgi:hypothetical protein
MLFSLLFSLSLGLATPVVAKASTTSSDICYTAYGRTRPKTLSSYTSTKWTYYTKTRIIPSYISTTVTPVPFTSTEFTDSTITNVYTAAEETATITTTVSEGVESTNTLTSTAVESFTVYETSTQSVEEIITTFSTLAGFTPVQSDSVNQPPPTEVVVKRSQPTAGEHHGGVHGNWYSHHDKPPSKKHIPYPIYVVCHKFISVHKTRVVTSAAAEVITKIGRTPTTYTTSTVVHTIDTYELPAQVSTTITVTSTSTDVVSETVTEQSTTISTQTNVEIARPTSTTFPACSPDNFIKSYSDNDHISGFSFGAPNFIGIEPVQGADIQACCEL